VPGTVCIWNALTMAFYSRSLSPPGFAANVLLRWLLGPDRTEVRRYSLRVEASCVIAKPVRKLAVAIRIPRLFCTHFRPFRYCQRRKRILTPSVRTGFRMTNGGSRSHWMTADIIVTASPSSVSLTAASDRRECPCGTSSPRSLPLRRDEGTPSPRSLPLRRDEGTPSPRSLSPAGGTRESASHCFFFLLYSLFFS
jgi:hypothetical protein